MNYGRCGTHGQMNNQYGYCSGCESDPNIVIKICNKCGTKYPINRDRANSSNTCYGCAFKDLKKK